DGPLIGVAQQPIDELEAGSFEQEDPSRDGHGVSDAIGMARAQERCVVIPEKLVGPRPEPLPILARVARRLVGFPLFESSRERSLRTGGLCEQEKPSAPERPVNVLDQLPRTLRVEPMKGADRRHDVVVAWKL